MKTVVLATGSRGWTNRGGADSVFTDLFDTHGAYVLKHGDHRKGLDMMADEWGAANAHLGIVVDPVMVTSRDWSRMGLAAGLLRNERMVGDVLELVRDGWHAECVAFLLPCTTPTCRRAYPHFTHGGDHCATLAKSQGINTTVYTAESFG